MADKKSELRKENVEFKYSLISSDFITLFNYVSCLQAQDNITPKTEQYLFDVLLRTRQNVDECLREFGFDTEEK
jgi:hypothetical protein